MDELYGDVLAKMETSHAELTSRVSPPEVVRLGDANTYRYVDRTIHQAIIQKLARVVSGLHAARLLARNGFFQEQAALQRMLDEFNEDCVFLANAVVRNDVTDLHREYLNAFYEGEFEEPGDPIASTQKRPMVSRQKVRAYLSRIPVAGIDPSSGVTVMRTIQKIYSGFVHGASPQIMDMFVGGPPRWHLRGMLETIRANEHREDLWNVFYRGIGSFVVAAKAFGDEVLCREWLEYMRGFPKAAGEDYGAPQQNA